MDLRLSLTLAVALLPALAGAAQPIELEWSAPPGCPERAVVLAELERLVSTSTAQPSLPTRSCGVIDREGEVFRLRLEIDSGGESGRRELRDASCLRLAQVAALSLALALESGGADPAPRPVRQVERPLEPPRWLIRTFLGATWGAWARPARDQAWRSGCSWAARGSSWR